MIDLNYVAGFFDGEGSVGVYCNSTRRPAFALRVQVTQVNSRTTRLLLQSMVDAFGGGISEQTSASGRGKLCWYVSGEKAAAFLRQIEDRLILKKGQVRVALDWFDHRPVLVRDDRGRHAPRDREDINHSFAVVELLKQMKKR